ncbi:MAG TPA: outer membrane protein assembly factor BamD [Thermodesulfobacteriota bacterium]|nr:outer membrane protein assembly factor BamD [Thermodesulfobacteriota bacterium]
MGMTSSKNSGVFGAFLISCAALFLLASCAATKEKADVPAVEAFYAKAVSSYENGLYEEAEASFKSITDEYPLSPQAIEAELMLGDTYYASERYDEASASYTAFQAFHPGHPKAAYALFQKGMSHFKEVLSVDRDQTKTRKALFAFEDLVKFYPESPYAEKSKEVVSFLRDRLAGSEMYVGRFYYKTKNYKGALRRFSIVIKDYRDTNAVDEALYYIGETYNSLGEKDLAKEAFATLVSDFPRSSFFEAAKTKF